MDGQVVTNVDFPCTCTELVLLEPHDAHCPVRIARELADEVARQDRHRGPFEGKPLARSRLALACLEDAAVAVRTLRDAL